MKIVVNKCFGGFDLSNAAQQEYLKRKGVAAFFYKQTKHKFSEGVDEYARIEANDESVFSYTFTQDLGVTFSGKLPENCHWYYGDIERTDPDLIAVVEILGSEKASGSCASVKVVEIPDGVEWEIDDYDGLESIHEIHRSW